MAFNPDPDKFIESTLRIKAAFNAAAENTTGPAKPAFEALNTAVNNAVDLDIQDTSLSSLLKAVSVLTGVQKAVRDVAVFAQTDAEAAETLNQLKSTMLTEMQSLGGGLLGGFDLNDLGKLGGLGGPQDDAPQAEQQAPKPQKKPRQKKPGGGDFNL